MTRPEDFRWRQEAPAVLDPPLQAPAPRSDRPFRRFRWVLFAADLGVAALGVLGAAALAPSVRLTLSRLPFGLVAWLVPLLIPALVGLAGLYKETVWTTRRRQVALGLKVVLWVAAFTTGGLVLFAQVISWDLRLALISSHLVLGLWLLAARPAIGKATLRRLARNPSIREHVLVVGVDAVARGIAETLPRTSPCARVIGYAGPDRPRHPGLLKGGPFHHVSLEDLPELARELGADTVVLARPDLPREQVVRLSDQLGARGVRAQVVSNIFNQLVDSVPFETLNGVPLVPVGQTPLRGGNEKWKRLFDVVGTVAGGLVILPALLLLALLVKLSSPGPVLYRQTRVGRDGRPFDFFKFRSMRLASEDPVHRNFARRFVENGPAASTDLDGKKVYKLVDDSRVTPIGRFLRRTSLDELPQLINVLKGEMSLVGPRPCLEFEYEVYRDWQKRRLDVTPGMTGLWQVTGRSYVTFEDMVLLDLFYIANWSFAMDLKILFRTIPVVIWGKGGL